MSSTDTTAQAGWYAVGGGFERYWDGSAWTEQKRPVPSYLHLIAAVPNGLTVEYMPWMLKLYEETPVIEKGQLVLPTKPGLGLKFDEKVVASYRAG